MILSCISFYIRGVTLSRTPNIKENYSFTTLKVCFEVSPTLNK